MPSRDRQAILAGAVILLLAAAACDTSCDEAHRGNSECRGDVSCRCDVGDDGPTWFQDACSEGDVCVDVDTEEGPRGLCVRSRERDPECPPDLRYAARCEESQIVSCRYGYPSSGESCEQDEVCVEPATTSAPQAICALSGEPDARCEDRAAPYQEVCAGDRYLVCAFGYVQLEVDCLVCDLDADDACT